MSKIVSGDKHNTIIDLNLLGDEFIPPIPNCGLVVSVVLKSDEVHVVHILENADARNINKAEFAKALGATATFIMTQFYGYDQRLISLSLNLIASTWNTMNSVMYDIQRKGYYASSKLLFTFVISEIGREND